MAGEEERLGRVINIISARAADLCISFFYILPSRGILSISQPKNDLQTICEDSRRRAGRRLSSRMVREDQSLNVLCGECGLSCKRLSASRAKSSSLRTVRQFFSDIPSWFHPKCKQHFCPIRRVKQRSVKAPGAGGKYGFQVADGAVKKIRNQCSKSWVTVFRNYYESTIS